MAMDSMFFLWAVLASISFVACLRYPGRLYIYASVGFAAAAFMAFFGAPLPFQLALAMFSVITAILFGEGRLNTYFVIFLSLDLSVIITYFMLFSP